MSRLIAISAAIVVAIGVMWTARSRSRREPGVPFVYVNQDGSARELSPAERVYLSTEFQGGDGARPYIKTSYESCDGWGSRSGFIDRRRVPSRIKVERVHPDYDTREREFEDDWLAPHRAAGDVIVENADGSIRCTPNPNLSHKERFERMRSHYLAEQRRRESLARIEAGHD